MTAIGDRRPCDCLGACGIPSFKEAPAPEANGGAAAQWPTGGKSG